MLKSYGCVVDCVMINSFFVLFGKIHVLFISTSFHFLRKNSCQLNKFEANANFVVFFFRTEIMALEYLVSNGDPMSLGFLSTKPKMFLAELENEELIKDVPGEMVLPSVERPLEFSKSVCKDNPAIKFNKGE